MVKKFLTILFIFVSIFVSSANDSFAQGNTIDPDNPWNPKAEKTATVSYREAISGDNCLTPSLECLVHQVFQFAAIEFVNSTLYSEVVPADSTVAPKNNKVPSPEENNPQDDSSIKIQNKRANNNILYGTGRLIGIMYANPAAKTSVYIADIMNSAHIAPQAYAQGLGFSSLNPILKLWKAFRNIAYMFFIIIFMVIGFMIMFRQRVGGQAAITAQQAIPGVIVSLIFVTFSYAIAGLLIDGMYLLMFLIIGIFGETLPDGSANLIDLNIRQLAGVLFTGGGVPTYEEGAESIITSPQQNIDLVSELIGNLVDFGGTGEKALGILGGIGLTVVLAIAILIGTVKLFFELLKSYASIIISVVTSPLVLMKGAIPGQNTVVPWLKDLVGNLLPFPVVLLVLVIFFQFTKSGFADGSGSGGFMPPFLLNNDQASSITSLLGLAIILALPEIVKESKKHLVSEGFGGIIFKAATGAITEGMSGGQPIQGVPIKIPGAKRIAQTVAFGSDSSRKKHEKDGTNDFRLGVLGGGYEKYKKLRNNKYIESTSEKTADTTKDNRSKSETAQGKGAQEGVGPVDL